ncbi:MAG: cation diffusion facilitator family transporter [Methylococcales bacterium]|jgi:solute carrier family 30 (zinc transporter), member 9|nr:cation diffusion facilitator family transporter [Methylococcales bacterium]MBT7445279.1 cation diffusion facilitator family transporter [Methylococcales bacterium]
MASSKTAVVTAIVSNSIVTVIKLMAALVSGSASMMNETVHSFMDTLNQAFLLRGLQVAEKPADDLYAFGHMQKKYLWNLWSAIGLFSIGAGLGLMHAWHSYHSLGEHTAAPKDVAMLGVSVSPLTIVLVVLFISLILEGYSFLVALKEFMRKMREDGETSVFRYLGTSDDPTLVAVVLEDSVAMLGLVFATVGIGLAAITGNPIWDIAFSGLIALMLGAIAFYLGYVNMKYLADMRDVDAESVFTDIVKGHPNVERWHDLRSIILDENNTLLIAEVELREEAVVVGLKAQIDGHAKPMLDAVPADKLTAEVEDYIRSRAAVQATLERTEQIVDELTAALKKVMPRVSHVTIEIDGIAADDAAGS